MKKIKAVRVDSSYGETRYILQEYWVPKSSKNIRVFDEYELVKTAKKDAAKRLLVQHE